MKKLNLLFTVVFLLAINQSLFSQAIDRLYLSISSRGSIYDITGVPATFPATAVVGAPAYTGANQNLISNLAVGYDTPGGNPAGLVYLHSNTASGSIIYKSTASTGQTITSGGAVVGGIGTNNVPVTAGGNPSGESYGFSTTTKNLYRVYPTAADLGLITGDAIWNATTSAIWATDTFFDYQNFVYVILQDVVGGVGTRYLYKVNPTTRVATLVTPIAKATTNPVAANPVGVYNNTPAVSNATSVGNIRGLAYLNGLIYAVSVNGNPGTELSVYTINISTGVSTFVRTYTGFTNLWATNQDLATVPYYIPFQFTCGGITQSSAVPFVRGVASNGQKFLNIPINNVYASGTYTINVIGTDFTSSSQVNITPTTTSVQVPLNYTGSGSAGVRTLQVNLNGSSTACNVNVLVDEDTDGDGIGNSEDLDDDNDGILDCDENLLGANTSVSNVFSFVTAGTAVATSNNEVRLTQNTGNQAGQIWSVGKVDFTKSFVLRFDAYLGTNDNGADGIAAVFHNSPQGVNATGAAGLGIGARGIANGIVLELDTYDNGTSLGDISSDHGQIWDSDNQTSTGFLTTAVALPNLENSTWHPVVINWNATTKTISYTVDGTNAGTYTGDLVTNYFAGANKVYFGYTASTGASTNEQRIRINSFCSDLPLELDKDGDGTPNYLDLDSDGDGCPDAIEGGDNVTAGMLDGIGRINVAANGTTTPVVVDANGVPVVTNTSSTYNVDGQAQGQTIGQSQINNPAAVAGTVGSNQTIVSGSAPSALSLTGSTGTIQWQSSTDNVTFTNISGATSASYSPGTMTSTTYYRAVVSSLGGCSVNTNSVVITVVPNTDSDGDGIVDYYDLDDDNDGILDADENTCIASSKIEGTPIFINDFGTGTPTTDPFVLSHVFDETDPDDGFYAVTTSNNQTEFYTQTNLIGNIDAGNPTITAGSTTGRFLMINIDSPNNINKAIYRVTGINTQVGQSYRFRIDMAGLAEGRAYIPKLKIAIKDASNNELASANSSSLGMANDDIWRRINLDFTATTSSVILEIINQQETGIDGNDVGIDNIVFTPLFCDADNDGTPNYLDLDSDNDGCADAIEGSENVKYNQIHDLNLPLADPNYAYRGQIKVTYNGTTTSTPSGIVSNSISANGVPQLLNNAGNNLNASTNPSNLAGTVDNTDGTADVGQGIGDSQDNTINSCKCYKAPSTDGNNYPTQHGITAFNRAGTDNQNWPMVRQSGWTALEASTKGFVINRMPVSTSGGNIGEPVDGSNNAVITSPIAGMMFYDTTNDCLKINVDGTRSGWKCFNKQTCPDEN